MTKSQWNQIGAAGGIVFVVAGFAAQGLIQVGGAEPAFNASAEEIMTFFSARNPQLYQLGGYLTLLSVIPFLWFLGVLWAALREYEGDAAWLSLVAFGSGLAGLGAVYFAAGGWDLALLRINEGLDPAIGRLAFDQGNLGFANYQFAMASLMLASGVVSVRDGALPRWLGWFGIFSAVLLLIGRWFWFEPTMLVFVPFMLLSLWIVATSIILIRRARHVESVASVSVTSGSLS